MNKILGPNISENTMVGSIDKEFKSKTEVYAEMIKNIEASSKTLKNKSQTITEVLSLGRQSINSIQNSLIRFQVSTGDSLDYVWID